MSIILSSDLHFGHKLCAIQRGYFNEFDEVIGFKESHKGNCNIARLLTQYVKTLIEERKITYNDAIRCINKMDSDIVERFNSKVTDEDEVYLLGDICFSSDMDVFEKLVNSLNGKHLYLIKGNHDNHKITSSKVWNGVYERYELKYNKELYILDHYPLATWNKAQYGSCNIHGHCHNTYRTTSQQIDIGVDTNDLYPYTIEEAINKMKQSSKFEVPDFHGGL